MRAAWRLALAGLSARRSRTILLVIAVALSAALIAAVSCAISSVNAAVEVQLETQLGRADVRLRPAGRGMLLPAGALAKVESWPGVAQATAVHETSLSITYDLSYLTDPDADGVYEAHDRTMGSSALAVGAPLDRPGPLESLELIAGRTPTGPGEVVIDALLAERFTAKRALSNAATTVAPLSRGDVGYLKHERPLVTGPADAADAEQVNAAVGVRPGDTIKSVRLLRRPVELKVVGIAQPPPLGGRPQLFAALETIDSLAGTHDEFTEIEIVLAPGTDADAFVEAHKNDVGDGALLTTTERITSGVERNVTANRVGFLLASMLAFLSAAFIIMTGLTTGLAEQQRALAVLRCIGATRGQLAFSQIVNGAIVGVLGALLGVPLGVFLAWVMTLYFHDRVPGGLAVSPAMLAVASLGSIVSGVLGACWPAWRCARMTPLAGLSSRAKPATKRGLLLTTLAGLACLALMLVIVGVPRDGNVIFWGYVTTGLPAMFLGYFLLSVPGVIVVGRLASPVLTRLFRLPPSMLRRTVAATPYRHGFTAGAMMTGLALMVAVWTNGGAFLRDWIARIDFPDAFVSGLALTPEAQQAVDELPFVRETCAISLYPISTDAFGVRGLTSYKTTFVAFEPEPFFRMASVEFVQGDPDYAKRRLAEGGAVIVAREFLIAKGLGAGDTFTCRGADGVEHTFEIVGVVTSPGLELVSKFFNIGDEFIEQAVHAVFGSRADLQRLFHADAIQLIQIELDPTADDVLAVATIRDKLFGQGIMDAGSGRQIKKEVITFVGASLVVFSAVAVGSMFIACFGVANLIAAGIHARRFELGVLRAVGGSKGLLARLIGAEACIVALTACLVGTAMGLQGAWAGRILYSHLIGIGLHFHAPLGAIGAGWAFVLALTIGAAAPATAWLNRRKPRELLAAGR